jgi:hypothetical protein
VIGRGAVVLFIAATVASMPLRAHHSIAMVDIAKPEWVKGTVTEFRFSLPHVIFTLQVKGADGHPRTMEVEGPNLARMERMHAGADFLKVGDVMEVCGFHLKQPWYKPDFIHGQLLVFPDGHMRHYGPYGKLENCLRPGDTAEKWVRFLHEDAFAMPAWCDSHKRSNVATVAPPGLVAEIDGRLGKACP